MEAFKKHHGIVALLDVANVDTDQIIPKQFLKSIKRTGFGEGLFYDWRFFPDGKPNPGFSLNRSHAKGASILVARNNFGCGSSREHAVWAIHQYGFKAVIAPWQDRNGTRVPAFADIFRNNSSKNGLLTVELGEKEVDEIFRAAEKEPGTQATVDLEKQTLTVHAKKELSFRFEIAAGVRNRLLHGLDDIGTTLRYESAIRTFESAHNTQMLKK